MGQIADSALSFLQRAPVTSTPHLGKLLRGPKAFCPRCRHAPERLIQETWRVLARHLKAFEKRIACPR